MAYIVQDRMEITIAINDQELPIGQNMVVDFIHIGASAAVRFPTMALGLTDPNRVFDKIGVHDGSIIKVTIRDFSSDTRIFRFRLFGFKKAFNGAAWQYSIEAVIDNPLWVFGTSVVSQRGTSQAVLQRIATTCGLTYSGTDTADSQIWMPQNDTYCNWADSIAKAGYANDKSCMSLALDWDGKLLYKDVNNINTTPHPVTAYQQKEGSYIAIDVQETGASGFTNAKTGYWDKRVTQSIVADSETHDQLSFTSDSKNPLFNKEVRQKAQAGSVRFGAIDVGNVHPMYERAKYQNLRYKNLFNAGLKLLLPTSSKIMLFDKINLAMQKENGSPDIDTSGIYLVTGHALLVQGLNFGEQIGVVRHGTNNNYTAK